MTDNLKVSPFDDEINTLRDTIFELSANKDWDAVELAKRELYGWVQKKKDWLILHSKDDIQ